MTNSATISAIFSSAVTSFLSDITEIPAPIVSQGDLNFKEHSELKYYLYMSIYVCMYVCMHACMYVCMYLCIIHPFKITHMKFICIALLNMPVYHLKCLLFLYCILMGIEHTP